MTDNKLSDTRQKIIEVIKESKRHMTADDVYLALERKNETVGIATVYRNLNYLYDHGYLSRLKDMELGYIYDYNLHKHYHMKCRVCHNVVDLEIQHQDALNQLVEKETGAISVTHDILFEGICKKCQNQ